MAVLRPDQAQLTFAAEAGPGGDVESGTATVVSGGGNTYLTKDGAPGERTIQVNASTSFTVGDQIVIGFTTNATATLASSREVRRIERISGTVAPITFTLDRPLGLFHPKVNNHSHVKEISAWAADGDNDPNDKFITWIPGVYETVDTPDPVMAIEPRYFLGTQAKRDFFKAYKGQQTFTGALNGIVLLNGWPLRFPFGSVVTVAQSPSGTGSTLVGSVNPGDIYIRVASGHGANFTVGSTAGDTVSIGESTVVTTTLAKNDTPEFRRVVAKTTDFLQLSSPLLYSHPNGATVDNYGATHTAAGVANYAFYHHILETIDLSSLTWQVRVADSDEQNGNLFIRRYVGGKVGSASISAEEGGLVTMNWDNVVFMDMVHNQSTHAVTPATHGSTTLGLYTADEMPGWSRIHDINSNDVGTPGSLAPAWSGFPTDEPYYFSQGTVTFWGTEFARIRSFNLTVNNNEDPRYYISGQYGRHRGPSEIREQRREYGMSCILALPDSSNADGGELDGATAMFRELLLEGQYDTTTMKGFKVTLHFEKANGDAIKIYLPGLDPTQNATLGIALDEPQYGSVVRTLSGSGNQQGCFIRSAAHNITGEAPLQTDAEILFRNMHIIIKDGTAIYP